MLRNTIRVTSGIFSLALVLTALAAAQQSDAPPTTQPGDKMSMGSMMKQCMQHCQTTSKSIDQASKAIEEARNSNDPAQMKEALGQAQKQLAGMKEHMSGCMDMMQNMRGNMMGEMKNGMMNDEQDAAKDSKR